MFVHFQQYRVRDLQYCAAFNHHSKLFKDDVVINSYERFPNMAPYKRDLKIDVIILYSLLLDTAYKS